MCNRFALAEKLLLSAIKNLLNDIALSVERINRIVDVVHCYRASK